MRCLDCKHFDAEASRCDVNDDQVCGGDIDKDSCPFLYTNGDMIRKGGDYALAHFKSKHRCDVCAYAAPIDTVPACRRPDGKVCFDGRIAWLKMAAESEWKK